MEKLTVAQIKEQVSIVGLLKCLGYEPTKTRGKDHIYLSMLRDNDTKPSLSVNDELGVWYDHGSGKGGTVIDFGLAFWNTLSFPEVIVKIQEVYNLPLSGEPALPTKRKRSPIKLPNYKISDIKPLGTNQVISDYLLGRGVWGVENSLLREIYYYVEDEKMTQKHFFAVGWQNELNGWEVRNKYFKGCLGKKGTNISRKRSKSRGDF